MIKTTMEIDGMMCGMCEAHVNDKIKADFDIKKVNSSHSKNQTVIVSEKELDAEGLKKAVGEAGYKVLSIKSEAYEEKGFFGK